MKENQTNNQQGKDTNVDPKQRQDGMDRGKIKTDPNSIKSSLNNNREMEDELETITNDLTTAKEHDDIDNNSNHETLGNQKINENSNENSTRNNPLPH